VVDLPVRVLGQASELGYRTLRRAQTGHVRWYAMGLVMGTVVFLAIAFFAR
jgi:NADH-quinone oxidoreductase subunit L